MREGRSFPLCSEAEPAASAVSVYYAYNETLLCFKPPIRWVTVKKSVATFDEKPAVPV